MPGTMSSTSSQSHFGTGGRGALSRMSQTEPKRPKWVSSSFDDLDINAPSEIHPKTKHPARSSQGKRDCNTLPQLLSRKRGRNEDGWGGCRTTDQQKHHKFVETDTWVDKYGPQTQSDLAVHKKKIAEVEDWLRQHLQQRKPCRQQRKAPILLLTGPAGAGKTATIRVLAKQLELEIQEWSNPTVADYDPDRIAQDRQDFNVIGGHISQSQTALFQDFLIRANRYPTLQLLGSDALSHKLCLVQDIPNAFYRDPQSLHSILHKFSSTGRFPLVFIVSDSYGGESSAYKLFPKDVQSSLSIDNISFNPVAPTSMVKAMQRVLTKVKRRFAAPSKQTLEALATASSGDIRSAINALQFACLKDTQDLDRALSSNQLKPSKTRHPGKATTNKSREAKRESKGSDEAALAAIGGRDTSMFLFRALGKILYCKREPKTSEDPSLPAHLARHDRDRLKIHPEEVLEQTHMSSEHFNLYLHQNYLDFYEHLEDIVEASHFFSDSDLLTCEWRSRSSMTTYGASLTSRAVIHCNTARSRCKSTGGGGWKPLHKPQWFEISRKYQESCAGAKGLFVGHCWTPVELQTQLIPYLALVNVPLENPGQITFLQEVARFTTNQVTRRPRPQKLNEQDGVDDDDEDDLPSSQGPRLLSQRKTQAAAEHSDLLMNRTSQEDNEIVIEDFDD